MTTNHPERPRASVFIATSIDGFIARPDDGLDWLTGKPDDGLTGEHDPAQDYGYADFFASVDALVMGRGTYDVVQGFDGWYYDDKPVYVWTSHPDDLDPPDGAMVRPVSGSLDDVVARLVTDGIGHVYVDGGKVIRQFLAAGLIDRMTISTPPILIGEGIPLFGGMAIDDVRLELVSCETFDGGMVQRTYDVVRGTLAPPSRRRATMTSWTDPSASCSAPSRRRTTRTAPGTPTSSSTTSWRSPERMPGCSMPAPARGRSPAPWPSRA